MKNETVWLSQQQMTKIFDSSSYNLDMIISIVDKEFENE